MISTRNDFIALALLATVGFASPAAANPRERTISVTGTAVTRAVPDTVVWHATTSSAHRNLRSAKKASDKKMQAILSTARSLGVAPKDIQTGYLSVTREYERGKFASNQTFKHFRVSRQITITERDVTRFDVFLTKLIESSDMEVYYTLESSEVHDLRAKTRIDSVVSAREKAEAMAVALGARLGPVLTISEEPYQGHANNTVSWNEMQSGVLDMGRNEKTFAPGTIDVRVSVTTVFQLR